MGAQGVAGTIVALTGTPGTGKSTAGRALRDAGYPVLELARFINDARFDAGADAAHHGSHIIDEAALSDHLLDNLVDELRNAVGEVADDTLAGPIFIDSHFAHELAFIDRIIVLRCRPDVLTQRLETRDWPVTKIQENVQAERAGIILDESIKHRDEAAAEGFSIHVAQVDTTDNDAAAVTPEVLRCATTAPTNLEIGPLDWAP